MKSLSILVIEDTPDWASDIEKAMQIAAKKFKIDIVKKYGAQQSTPSKNNGQKKK